MTDSALQNIIGAINHNAGLLEHHLGDGVFVHRQESASTTWKITHSLGSLRPLIETYDSNGNRIGHSVNRESQTFHFCEAVFAVPLAGTAILRF